VIDTTQIAAFSAIAFLLVITPGPNMIYLISRSLSQGKTAGLISLAGVILGFIFYMACASFGITAFLFAIPYAYDTIKILGVCYLLWMAWNAIKPNGTSIFQPIQLKPDSPLKLLSMGFVTNLLNPKIAIMYLSLLPQFIQPGHGSIFMQSMLLGSVQIIISFSVQLLVVFSAGSIAVFFNRNPLWANIQRWVMGTLLATLAVRILIDNKR